MKTIEEAVNAACRDLPEGWELHLHMENGCAWVELNRPTYESEEFQEDDCTLAEQISNALAVAIELKDTEAP